jgi:vanillate O-demethylase ferredoxin subunit
VSLLELRVARRRREAADVCSLELVDPANRPLPAFTAGAHVDIHLRGGLVRSYSLCDAPGENRRYRIAVLREQASRGGSAAVHALREGDMVCVGEPRNHFELSPDAGHHLLLAGGIGITPLLAMAHWLTRQQASFALHYSARSRDRAAFVSEVRESFGTRAHQYFDEDGPGRRLPLSDILDGCDPSTHLYVCGPAAYIEWVLESARAAGWAEARLHSEHFAAPTRPGGDPGSNAFEVQIASTGRIIQVPPDRSVADMLHASGIELPLSCEQGICGTCIVGVLEGTPDHRDAFLTPAELAANDRFTPCCSRARSPRLVLDL